jgi:DNA-binding MarR family transcriptional regulator
LRGAADQSTIAADVGLDRTTTAETLRRLANRGLVRREISKQDRRARLCRLTPHGRTILKEMEGLARDAHRATLDALTRSEQRTLLKLLTKAIAANSETVAPIV